MRRLLFSIALACSALSVAACQPVSDSLQTGPVSTADATKLDEQTMLSAESLYLATNTLAQTAFDLGRLSVDQRAKVKAADQKAYNALLVLRSAYRAGNASSYFAALGELTKASEQVSAIIGSR